MAEKKTQARKTTDRFIEVELLTSTARAEKEGRRLVVYPDIQTAGSIVNSRTGMIPINIRINSQRHDLLLWPHAKNPDLVPMSQSMVIPAGDRAFTEVPITNRGAMVKAITPETPLFVVHFLPVCTDSIKISSPQPEAA